MAIEIPDQSIEQRLSPSSGFHAKLLSRLTARQKMSEANIRKRYDAWDRVDEHCRMFIDLSRKAKNADGSTGTKLEMPWPRSIVIPLSYAILQVYMTQLMAIFMRRDPMIEVEGVGPEDVRLSKIMDAVLAYDQKESIYPLQLYSFAMDSVKYGVGVETDYWMNQYGWKFIKRPPSPMDALLDAFGIPKVTREWDLLKQYNKIESCDPFMFWPDPRTSLSNIQGMEFIGHRVWCAYLDILSESQENGGPYFNIAAVANLGPNTSGPLLQSRNRFNTQHLLLVGSTDERDKGFHAKDVFKIKLIPREWELSEETRPEIWEFTMVDLQVIIRAHRSEYQHGQFNYSVTESNCDPHVTLNPGVIENLDGLQRFINWKYNSHVQNVIRHLNNSMAYAPSLIEQMDILHPQPAGHFRLSPLGEKLVIEGRITTEQVFHQVQKFDVTSGMLQEIGFDYDMAMRMTGAADQMQGVNPKANRTLGEQEQVMTGASGRMGFHAGMIENMAIRPLALRLISNRQQFTEQEQYYKISGELMRQVGVDVARLLIGPQDLQGNYDYTAKSGPTPPTEAEMQMAWLKFGQLAASNPVLFTIPDSEGMVLDPVELAKEVARTGFGIRNIDSYRKLWTPPQVMDDEKLDKEKQKGNVVPMERRAA